MQPAIGSRIPLAVSIAVIRGILALTIVPMLGTLTAVAQSREPIDDPLASICSLIDTTARLNSLPVDFFTRLIWQESRLQPDVIGPLTRSGKHAEGIAQFMPGTAAERGLLQPFNPVEALPKSGEFLAELRDEFGNVGLAAAAYNAGPQRLRDFLARSRDLPLETRSYVLAVTGHSVDEWSTKGEAADKPADHVDREGSGPVTCRDVVTRLGRAPAALVARGESKAFPSWCNGLRHPDVRTCGPVHLTEPSIRTAALGISRTHASFLRSGRR